MLSPVQIEVLFPASTLGSGLTFTLIVSVLEQELASVPVTMYCVVSAGQARGLEILILLKLSAGDHE